MSDNSLSHIRTYVFCWTCDFVVGKGGSSWSVTSIAPGAQLLNKNTKLLHQINKKAPPAVRNSSDVARALNWRRYPHTGKGV